MGPKDELEDENSGLDDRLGVIDPDTYVESDWDEPDYDEEGLRALAEVPPDTSGIPEEDDADAVNTGQPRGNVCIAKPGGYVRRKIGEYLPGQFQQVKIGQPIPPAGQD